MNELLKTYLARTSLVESDTRLRHLERRAAESGSEEDRHAHWTAKERAAPGSVEHDHLAHHAEAMQKSYDAHNALDAEGLSAEQKKTLAGHAKARRAAGEKLYRGATDVHKWHAARDGKDKNKLDPSAVEFTASKHIKRKHAASWEHHVEHLADWFNGSRTPDFHRRGNAPHFASHAAMRWNSSSGDEDSDNFLKSLKHHKAGTVQRHTTQTAAFGETSHNIEINRPDKKVTEARTTHDPVALERRLAILRKRMRNGTMRGGLSGCAAAIMGLKEDAASESEKHCGVFIPLPHNLGKEFPDKKEEDSSVPHYTLLYVGELTAEDYKTLVTCVSSFAEGIKPFDCDISVYHEFLNPKGQKIPHMCPSPLYGIRLARLHSDLRRYIEVHGKGIASKIKHTYGKNDNSKLSYESKFKPHATLAYIDAKLPYRGPKPTGSWRVTELECWGYEQARIPLGRTRTDQPLGIAADFRTMGYPAAVPTVKELKNRKTVVAARYITRQELLDMKKGPGKTFTIGEVLQRAKLEMKRTGLSAEELLQREDVIGGSMGASGHGAGGSSGDTTFDGSLMYLKIKQDEEKRLKRTKLAGRK